MVRRTAARHSVVASPTKQARDRTDVRSSAYPDAWIRQRLFGRYGRKWPEMCSFLPAHRRGLAGRPRLRPLKNVIELRTREVLREPDRRTSGSVKLHTWVTALGQQGTKAEPGRLGVFRLTHPWCARPTGGSHARTTADHAHRFKGAKRRPRCSMRAWRSQGHHEGRSPLEPRPGVLTKELQ